MVSLSNIDKKELRKIYAEYKSCRNSAERSEVIAEMDKNFPTLVENNISIHDLPEHIYSENQRQFIEDCENDFEIDYSYSGCGMFGDVCPAIRCERNEHPASKAKYVHDSMGLGMVYYAQN